MSARHGAGPAVVLQTFGAAWSLATPSVELVGALAQRLPPLVLASPEQQAGRAYEVLPVDREDGGEGVGCDDGAPAGGTRRFLVRGGARRPVVVDDAGAAANWIADDLRRFLARRVPARVLVHAAAVAWRGRAVLLAGPSGSGKSRWVEALLALGFDYLSDDLVALDGAGQAEGFARPLALRRVDGSFERRAARELGAAVVSAPLPVGAVVFAPYRAGGSDAAAREALALERVSPAQCTLALLRHVVAARRRFELAGHVLPVVAASAAAARGRRGEAGQAAERLLEWLEGIAGRSRSSDRW